MCWSRARRSFDSVNVRPPRTGKRTHLEDATVRSVCHRVVDEQDEGSIMTKWDELISRNDHRVDEDCVLRSQISDGKCVGPRVYGGVLGWSSFPMTFGRRSIRVSHLWGMALDAAVPCGATSTVRMCGRVLPFSFGG